MDAARHGSSSHTLMVVLPDHLPGPDDVPRVLTRRNALELGYSRHAIAHRVRTRQWHLILPGVLLTGSTLTWSDRVSGAVALTAPDGLLTGAAALADLGLSSVRRPDRMLVLVPRASRVRPAGWVRIRRTARMPSRSCLPGPPRAELARAVADLALERRGLDDVRALLAQALRARLCTLDELATELAGGPRQGSRNLRRALDDLGAGAWSAPEAHAADVLRTANVPTFEQNASVHVAGWGLITVDFLWRRLRAVLEIDSDKHHYELPADRDWTARRSSLLQTGGFTVMSRRPGYIRRAPGAFRGDVELWLGAREAELFG